MGDEISHSQFESSDFGRFEERLGEETSLLADMFAAGRMSDEGFTVGFEIEAWLLDHGYFPHPVNDRFLGRLDDPLVVPELSRFNVELNCEPLALTGNVLSRAAAQLGDLWERCNAVAHEIDTNMVMIGTLPNIRDADLTLDNMSPLQRYAALNAEILRHRSGRPLEVEIVGDERLSSTHRDVMLEAATTSFQIHLKTPARLAHRYYNASIMASGPVLACGVNAPFLFGRTLWDETRIPLFEQSVALTGNDNRLGRVSFGSGYLEAQLNEALAENLANFPVLLPILFDEPADRFRHLRLHNGTIWRWNRPLIGFEEDGTPHLRIEHRVLPAGPTVLDMIANAAFYFGLVHEIVRTGLDEAGEIPFETAQSNFYAAARHGLGASLSWSRGKTSPAGELLLEELIPAAERGLEAFGVDREDREFYLDIVRARVRSGQTGAAWQRGALVRRGGDFFELMAAYCERQRGGDPVHQWDR